MGFQSLPHIELKTKEIQFSNAEFLPEVVKLMDEGYTITLPLKGFSMRPFLEDGRDKALIAKAQDVHIGDVVLAEIAPKCFVFHRVTAVSKNKITLRGDGNLYEEHCDICDVKGIAIGFYRKGSTRIDHVNGIKWRLYSQLWMELYPIRRYLLAAYRKIWLKLFNPI